jgi:glycogen synthase
MVASECAPVAQAGGLGEVVFGLSRELEKRGHAVDIILPKYDCMRAYTPDATRVSQRIAADLAHFRKWTSAHGKTWLPATPRSVAEYLSELAETMRPATLIGA